jgi:wee1-like protein kinase
MCRFNFLWLFFTDIYSDMFNFQKIGNGNFSVVFKVLNRIDGCLYAVKRSIKQLNNDMER